jgi:hypothetical protein
MIFHICFLVFLLLSDSPCALGLDGPLLGLCTVSFWVAPTFPRLISPYRTGGATESMIDEFYELM